MLKRLDISNYALIDNASIHFESGFSTITGETGAGKSILLKALNLLLGDRADTTVLKQSDKNCFLEAEFLIDNLKLQTFFQVNDLEYETPCIIRREFTSSGKSRCFVNDSPVQINQLKELGERLVNIHSQHETLQLFSTDFQLEVLDSFSELTSEVETYRSEFISYRNKVNKHIELKVKDLENRKEKDYLAFLIQELALADLDNTDLAELKITSDKIEFAQKISEGLSLANSVFDNDTYGPQVGIKTLIETFDGLKKFDPKYADILGRLLSLKIEMDDINSEVSNQSSEIEFSDTEAKAIRDKMDLLNSLCFKHNLNEVEDLIALKDKFEVQMNEIEGVENDITTLAFEIKEMESKLNLKAKQLHESRLKNAGKLSNSIKAILEKLAMPDAEIQVETNLNERLNKDGLDDVQFLFKTNKGGQFLPLKKVASGGELSRLMLAIMSILSQTKKLPTLIFDEIDTGVSGEVASKIANEFAKMGAKIQVVSITHLPQIAARGTNHYHVSKSSSGDKTTTQIKMLSKDERITELAKMISGEELTNAARENAAHLLNIS